MRIAFFIGTIVMLAVYAHVSNNVERYANSGNIVARAIILMSGLMAAAVAALFFLKNVDDPTWAFGIGFFISPLAAIAACFYLVVGALFPLRQVRGLLRYSFRHKLHDEL